MSGRATGRTAAAGPGTVPGASAAATAPTAANAIVPAGSTAIDAVRVDGAPRREGLVRGDAARAVTPAQRARAAVAIPGLPAPEPTPVVVGMAATTAAARPAVEGSPTVAASATATAQRTTAPTREGSPSPVLTAAAARITAAIDKVLDRLSTLPASPIGELLSGVLLLVRRAFEPPAPGFFYGYTASTQLTVRNKSDTTFAIWAYDDGYKGNELLYVTTLTPGAEWTNTAFNYGIAGTFNHNLVIGSTGPTGEFSPRMRVSVDYYGTAGFAWSSPTRVFDNFELGWDESKVIRSDYSGEVAWVWRGPNLEKDYFWDPDFEVVEVEIWQVPQLEYRDNTCLACL